MRCATPVRCRVVGHLTVDDAPCVRDRLHPKDVGTVVVGGLVGIAWVWFLVVMLSASALAHTPEELDAWRAEWADRVLEVGGLTPELAYEWIDMKDRHGCDWPGTTCTFLSPIEHRSTTYQGTAGVEQWRSLVARYFAPGDVDLALRIIGCESQGVALAKNPTSSASGLFQHLGRYWPERSAAAGWVGANIFDPEANVAVAAWLRGDGWHHWNPSRGCWG